MPDRDQLLQMLRRFSIRNGDFTLVSGQKSEWYVDAKLTTYKAAAMPLVGRAFLDKIAEREWAPRAVGGLTLGADAIAIAIARESLERNGEIDSFVMRKEPKKHGTKRFLEGLENADGRPVVILDDVCTTGGSTAMAIERARESGMIVLGAICLVDREMGAEEQIERGLQCPFDRIYRLSELIEGFQDAKGAKDNSFI